MTGEPLYGEWTQRWGRHGTRMLLGAHPEIDAIFCGNDQIATGAAEILTDLGRRIPDDVAIVGYDNWEAFAADCRPPLTTVDLNLEQLGATAVMHLCAALDGEPRSGVIRQPCRLVVRESTGPLPAPGPVSLPAPGPVSLPASGPVSLPASGPAPPPGSASPSGSGREPL